MKGVFAVDAINSHVDKETTTEILLGKAFDLGVYLVMYLGIPSTKWTKGVDVGRKYSMVLRK